MDKTLVDLLDIASDALKNEDTAIRDAMAANKRAYPGGQGGILRINNERYYQFLVARALALTQAFPFPAKVELATHDLVLQYPANPSKWFAVVEMKRWMTESGAPEIPGIIKDMGKLQQCRGENAMLLLFSTNDRGDASTQLDWLSKELADMYGFSAIKGSTSWEIRRFDTVRPSGKEVEFWVAGYQVK